MELATLARMAPGQLIAGLGHGVQDWMDQIGARPESPVATLIDVITAVRRLLTGETVTMEGPNVTLRGVRLDQVPDPVPPLLAGVHGPKSLAAAGRCADGIVLAPMYGPAAIRHAIAVAAPSGAFQVVVYSVLSVADDRLAARRAIAPLVAETVLQGGSSGLLDTPFYADLAEIVAAGDLEELVQAPDEWWIEIGAIGTPDDIGHHVDALAAAGADAVSFFPAAFVDEARLQVDRVLAEVVSRR